MNNKFLPIGSIVLLKNAKKKLMITGFCMADKNNPQKKYDYCGCLFPEGIMDTDKMALFNHQQIDKIFYLGYSNEEEIEFKNVLNEVLSKQENLNNINTSVEENSSSTANN